MADNNIITAILVGQSKIIGPITFSVGLLVNKSDWWLSGSLEGIVGQIGSGSPRTGMI